MMKQIETARTWEESNEKRSTWKKHQDNDFKFPEACSLNEKEKKGVKSSDDDTPDHGKSRDDHI